METKKNPRADMNRYRSTLLMAGLAVSLGGALAALGYSQQGTKTLSKPFGETLWTEDYIPIPLPPEEMPKQRVRKIDVQSIYLAIKPNDAVIETNIDWPEFDPEAVIVNKRPMPEERTVADPTEIFVIAENMPQFMGGDVNEFRNWVMGKLRYPEAAADNSIQGRVILSFVIEKDGTLTNVEVLQTPDRSLSEEAERVLLSSPAWTPGRQRATPIRVRYTIPVEFRLSGI